MPNSQKVKGILVTIAHVRAVRRSLLLVIIPILFAGLVPLLSTSETAHAAGCPAEIQQGSSGTAVRWLQEALNSHDGLDFVGTSVLSVDGDFGPLTNADVVAWQSQMRLSVDGIVGPQTWNSLGFCGWSGSSGTSGGGCRNSTYVRACISVDAHGLVKTNVYLLRAVDGDVVIQLLEDGSYVNSFSLEGALSSGTNFIGPTKQISPGHIWQAEVFGVDLVQNFYGYSPVQFS